MKDTNKKKIDRFKTSIQDSFNEERMKNIDISIEGYLDKFESLSNMDIPEDTKDIVRQIKLLQMKNDDKVMQAIEILKKIERNLLDK